MFKNQPLISVLMPVFNTGIFLKESISSILNQTFKDFEFIIIDDASTDDSVKLINAFNDSRIILIKNINNLGIADTLNVGIEKACGKYIARMDSDDVAYPFRLEKQMVLLEKNPEIGLCGTNGINIDEIGNSSNKPWFSEENKVPLEWCILWENVVPHPTAMFRSDLLDKYHLRYQKIPAEDAKLWVDLIQHCRVGRIDAICLKTRERPTSLYRSNPKPHHDSALHSSRDLAQWISKKEPPIEHDFLTNYKDFSQTDLKNLNFNHLNQWLKELMEYCQKIWHWSSDEKKAVNYDFQMRLVQLASLVNTKHFIKKINSQQIRTPLVYKGMKQKLKRCMKHLWISML